MIKTLNILPIFCKFCDTRKKHIFIRYICIIDIPTSLAMKRIMLWLSIISLTFETFALPGTVTGRPDLLHLKRTLCESYFFSQLTHFLKKNTLSDLYKSNILICVPTIWTCDAHRQALLKWQSFYNEWSWRLMPFERYM